MRQKHSVLTIVHLILKRGKKSLMLRRKNTGFHDGFYSFPGGSLKKREHIADGAARELKEETGVSAKSKNLKIVHVVHIKGKNERLDFYFTAENFSGRPKICEPEKCDDVAWFPIHAPPEKTIPYIKQVIKNIHKKNFYSEWKE